MPLGAEPPMPLGAEPLMPLKRLALRAPRPG
jgi:hypothetical protein